MKGNVMSKLLIMAITAVFVLSFANAALANGSMQSGATTLNGEVVAVDNVHNDKIVTLQSNQIGQFPNDKLNIFLGQNANIKVCNVKEPFKDIKVGRDANVKYHEMRGIAVADSISERC